MPRAGQGRRMEAENQIGATSSPQIKFVRFLDEKELAEIAAERAAANGDGSHEPPRYCHCAEIDNRWTSHPSGEISLRQLRRPTQRVDSRRGKDGHGQSLRCDYFSSSKGNPFLYRAILARMEFAKSSSPAAFARRSASE